MTNAVHTLAPPTKSGRPNALVEEIARYLEAVELFRALGREPTWAREDGAVGPVVALVDPFIERVRPA